MSLTPISHLRDEIVELYAETGSYLGTANKLYNLHPELAKPNQLRAYIRTELTLEGGQDLEVIAENVRLAKAAQRSRDIGRVKDKSFREHARIENAVTEYNAALLQELRDHSLALGMVVALAPSTLMPLLWLFTSATIILMSSLICQQTDSILRWLRSVWRS